MYVSLDLLSVGFKKHSGQQIVVRFKSVDTYKSTKIKLNVSTIACNSIQIMNVYECVKIFS